MRIAVPFLALLVLLAGMTPAAALGPVDDAPESSALDRSSLASIDEPLLTEIRIVPDPGGDARWTVSIRYNLSSEADRAAFDRYGREFEAGDADTGLDLDFFRTLASEASRATGREMTIRNPDWNATVDNGTGTLNLSFTWTDFVTDTENGFAIQDSVVMPGNRTWLSSLGPSQRLVVETPPGYQVTDTRFGLTNGSVVIDGPYTFREPLSISYQQSSVEEPPESPPWSLLGGALLVGLGLVAAVIYVRRRRGDASTEGATDAGTAAGASAGAGAGAVAGTEDEADAEAETDAGDEDRGATEAGGGAASVPEGDETADDAAAGDVDPALFSDEERVEYLLEQNGGRMRQGQIVKETGWSDAKVSQLLSAMADEDRIEKLRLGRENLISLPDEDHGP